MLCQTPQSNSAFSLGFWLSVQFDHWASLLLTHFLPWFHITFTPEFLTRLALTSPTPGWSHITSLIPNPATEYLLEPHSLQECPSLLPAKPPHVSRSTSCGLPLTSGRAPCSSWDPRPSLLWPNLQTPQTGTPVSHYLPQTGRRLGLELGSFQGAGIKPPTPQAPRDLC